ncbi:hypothetical protein DW964_12815 [Ruminococcus sp. AM47-2BH]|nr:hypothetical protein DW964_12815 [Ruminococcus sp. AM47-2BH]
MDNKMRIMSEEFENTNTGEKVTGVTVMIDGKLKQVFDVMIKKKWWGKKLFRNVARGACYGYR